MGILPSPSQDFFQINTSKTMFIFWCLYKIQFLEMHWFLNADTLTRLLIILATAFLGLWNEIRTRFFKKEHKNVKSKRNKYYVYALIAVLVLTVAGEIIRTKKSYDDTVKITATANQAEARLKNMDSIVNNSMDSLKTVLKATDTIKKINEQLFANTTKQVSISKSISSSITKMELVQKDVTKTQKNILSNTERSLEPLIISSVSITLEYDFSHPLIARIVSKIDSFKNAQEKFFAIGKKTEQGIEYHAIPGVYAFPDETNKIASNIWFQEEAIKEFSFNCPSLEFQIYDKIPIQTRVKDGGNDSTYTVSYDPPSPPFEFRTYSHADQIFLYRIDADLNTRKVRFTLSPAKLHSTIDNGKILSFRDLFGKYIRISAYYDYWQENQTKIDIISAMITNDRKKLQFILDKKEKSAFYNVYNATYFHKILETDQIP